jgi:predicted MFS family arabinose efflux permease
MGALNLAALNLANSLGAVGGALTINAGFGVLSTVWAGFVLTLTGLFLYVATITRRVAGPRPSVTGSPM